MNFEQVIFIGICLLIVLFSAHMKSVQKQVIEGLSTQVLAQRSNQIYPSPINVQLQSVGIPMKNTISKQPQQSQPQQSQQRQRQSQQRQRRSQQRQRQSQQRQRQRQSQPQPKPKQITHASSTLPDKSSETFTFFGGFLRWMVIKLVCNVRVIQCHKRHNIYTYDDLSLTPRLLEKSPPMTLSI